MKKQILLYFLLVIMANISCSKDKSESEIVNEESMEEETFATKLVSESIQKRYNTTSGDLEAIYRGKFENNRLAKFEYFNANEELTGYQLFDYNSDGLLTSLTGYATDGTLNYESTLLYDDEKRLISEETNEGSGNFTTTVAIQYNGDNTITRTEEFEDTIEEKVYFLNENNIIYKVERTGSVLDEATYDTANNVLSMNNENVTYSYYDKAIEKKGVFKTNILGGNNNNVVLWGEYLLDQVENYGINYINEITYSSSTTTYEREFDEDNFPLKWSIYYSGNLSSETDLVYQ